LNGFLKPTIGKEVWLSLGLPPFSFTVTVNLRQRSHEFKRVWLPPPLGPKWGEAHSLAEEEVGDPIQTTGQTLWYSI
jgi:hypothetical protein